MTAVLHLFGQLRNQVSFPYLAAMHRGYTAERYLDRLAAARVAVPDLAVTTDLIVGFPGETDDDHERTLEVVAEAAYDSAYTFVFSPRPGTEAATLVDRFLPAEAVAERFERLRVVVERSALARHRARVGRVEEVVVEGPSRKDPALTTGRTGQNKLVHFATDRALRPGTYAERLTIGPGDPLWTEAFQTDGGYALIFQPTVGWEDLDGYVITQEDAMTDDETNQFGTFLVDERGGIEMVLYRQDPRDPTRFAADPAVTLVPDR